MLKEVDRSFRPVPRLRNRNVTSYLAKVIDERREITTGLDLAFDNSAAKYDRSRDIAEFDGEALGSSVTCAISREALDDHFGLSGSSGRTTEERLETFRTNRSLIEQLARHKYLFWPVEQIESVTIKTLDVSKIDRGVKQGTMTRSQARS